MGRKSLSVAEAKATLSDAIREVEAGNSLVITRHGKAVAALVRADDLATLERLRSAGPAAGLASIAGGWEASEELVAAMSESARRGRRPSTTLE
jgi:prevent-host-death family protein